MTYHNPRSDRPNIDITGFSGSLILPILPKQFDFYSVIELRVYGGFSAATTSCRLDLPD
jgi:hypothetical protein